MHGIMASWYRPNAEIVEQGGFQTTHDFRDAYKDHEEVIAEGGLVPFSWKAANEVLPVHRLAYIREFRNLWLA